MTCTHKKWHVAPESRTVACPICAEVLDAFDVLHDIVLRRNRALEDVDQAEYQAAVLRREAQDLREKVATYRVDARLLEARMRKANREAARVSDTARLCDEIAQVRSLLESQLLILTALGAVNADRADRVAGEPLFTEAERDELERVRREAERMARKTPPTTERGPDHG